MLVKESFLRDIARIIIWYPFRWLIGFLPIKISFRIFALLGDIHYLILKIKNSPLPSKFSILVGDDEKRQWELTKKYLQIHYIDRLCIFTFPKILDSLSNNFMEIDGFEHLESAITLKKGAIILQAHYGPVQIALFAIAFKGLPVIQVRYLQDLGLSRIGKNIAFAIRKKYEELIPAEFVDARSYLRPLVRALQQNKVVFINGDGTGGRERIGSYQDLDLFNVKYAFPVGAYKLSRLSGSPILPARLLQCGTENFRFQILPPLKDGEILEQLEQFRDYLEQWLKDQPHMWHFWDQLNF